MKDYLKLHPRYKTLDAEEAEEKFAQRGKILNKWAVMVNKKIKTAGEEDEADPDEGEKKGKVEKLGKARKGGDERERRRRKGKEEQKGNGGAERKWRSRKEIRKM